MKLPLELDELVRKYPATQDGAGDLTSVGQ
jgi:hypothetical protein